MTQLRELYQCEVCGNVIEVVNEGAPALVCCNQSMVKLEPKAEDTGKEKHVPVVEEIDCGIRVKVGSVDHPMEEKHYIKFIEVLTQDKIIRGELRPGQKPEAEFCIKKSDLMQVREFCTIHGVWKN